MTQQNNTLGVEITTSPYGNLFSYGHLIWWTIHQGIRDPKVIQESADRLGLPKEVVDYLTGVKEKGAWEKATNLRTNTLDPIADEQDQTKTVYTTRDVNPSTRILVREVIDSSQIKLSAKQYGILSFEGGFRWTPDQDYFRAPPELQEEIDTVISELSIRYYSRVDMIDDSKLRNALLRWLESRHRVSVRGNGGIYYIPNGGSLESRDAIVKEILVIRDWLNQCGIGVLTAIEIKQSETTTIVDLVQSAIDEITTELSAVEEALEKYRQNQNMNAGSRMEASKAQVSKMTRLIEKAEALEDSLGERVGVMRMQAEIVARRANSMFQRSSTEVIEQRAAKKGV